MELKAESCPTPSFALLQQEMVSESLPTFKTAFTFTYCFDQKEAE
jgi:hypothetical protein